MRYLFSKCEAGEGGAAIIPADLCARWDRQCETPYEALTEDEKDSDRKEARMTLDLIFGIGRDR